jgi:Ca2+-binding RTX toxin-like protein
MGDTITARGSNNTLNGGAGNDLLVSSGANNLLVASAGSDTLVSGANGATFQVASVAQLTASSISGGAGSDTLRITSVAQISDAQFAKVKGTEVLSLTGASAVTLGAAAQSAGVNFVVAGSGNSTLTQSEGYTAPLTLAGGTGKDLINVATASQLAADSIFGGASDDTLSVSSNVTLNNTFSRVNGVEVLSLTGASAVTLGGSAGFSTVIAGSINQDSLNNRAVRMIGSTLNDSFTVATAAQLAANTIVAGTGTDTLAVSQAATIADNAFANVSGVEVLSLGGNSTVTLDRNASRAGITSVRAASGAQLDLSVTSGNSSSLTIAGGNSGDTFRFNAIPQFSRSSISGGLGNDTLILGVAGVINDTLFARVSSVEAVSLAGGNTVTIGKAASDAGISTIYGGAGTLGSAFTQTTLSSGAQTIIGGAGNDLFAVGSDSLLVNDSLVGAGGTDTLRILSDSTLSSGTLSGISGIEVLQLSGKSSLATSDVPTDLNTIYGGNGDSNYSVTAPGKINLIAGTGSDRFQLSGANLLSDTLVAVTLSGGQGIDTMIVDGTLGLNDAFANVTGTEILSLNGAASVTLGGAAKTAGITQVFTGGADTLGVTVVQTEEATQNLSITTGKGNDLISITNGILLSRDTIDAGDGINTLRIEESSRILDRNFANVASTQILSLVDDKNYVEVGTNAAETSSLATVVGAGSDNTIVATKFDGDSLTFDFSQSDGDNSLVGSSSVANLFLVGEGALGTTTIRGGSSSDGDTLSVTLEDGIEDSMFGGIRGVESLDLSGEGSVELGARAMLAGLSNISHSGSTGEVTFARSAGAMSITADTLGTAYTYSYTTAGVAATDTLVGSNTGKDTLFIQTGGEIADSLFANKEGIQAISLSGNTSITLGAAAEVFAGSNDDTTVIIGAEGSSLSVTQTAQASFILDGSQGEKNYFQLDAELLAEDTIIGSGNTDSLADTLAVSGGEVTDEVLENVSGVAILQLQGDSLGNASVELGENASAAVFASVVGSSGNMTFRLSALPDEGFVLDGRLGDKNLFSFAGETLAGAPPTLNSASDILAANTLIGGNGIDTIFLDGDVELEAGEALANVSGVEVLSLSGSTAVTLAGSRDLASVFGGDGDMTFNVDGGSLYVNSSGAESNLFGLSDATLLGDYTLVGSDGDDTLTVLSGDMADTVFGNISGVPILSLAEDHSVVLGEFASLSGISTVYGGDGDVSVDLLAGAYDFEAGEAEGSFLVKAANSGLMEDSTFTGNGERSTLAFAAGEISDDAFGNVKNVGSVVLTGSSSITLDENAAKISSDTLSVSVIGGSDDSTFILNAGSFVLDGSGSETNLFVLANASTLAAGNTIIGGDGSDTLVIAEGDTLIGDTVFAGISDVEVLSLADSSNLSMGTLAGKSGVAQLILGIDSLGEATGGDYRVNLLAGASDELLLDGSAAESVRVEFANASLAATTTLYGGVETDTLAFGAGNAIEDEAFANIQGFEVLSVTGGSSVTLGAAAAASGLESILGGAGINTIIQDADNANALYISGGAGQLSVELDDVFYMVNNTILGGTSTLGNTLSVKGDGNIYNSYFDNHQRLQTVLLAGDNSMELGSAADAAGVSKVIVEDGDNNFTVLADGPSGVTLDASAGDGNNSFAFENADQLLTARVYGSDGEDTLSFVDEAAIGDTLFARVDSIEVLELGGASDVTLGTIADSAGLSTVIGGSGGTTFTQDSLSSNSYYLDGSASTEEGNTFVIGSAAQVAENTLIGGDGVDTLQVGEDAIEDADIGSAFANIFSVEVLQLTGSSSVVLGANADNSGLQTVVGGSGNNIFTHTSSSESSYYFDGADGISNLFSVADAVLSSNDTFVGGKGVDTLQIGEDVIDDTAFVNHESIEVLQLTGSSEVTLGESADDAGIVTVIGGAGSNTITQNVGYVSSFHLDGSEGTSNLFVISDTTSFTQGTILGGIGIDTVQVGEDVIGDAAFTNHRDLDVIQLTGTSDITVGEKADLAGISTVIGGEGSSTFTHLEKNYGILLDSRFFFDGSGSTNNLFVLNDASQLATDTLLGAEEDTLSGASGIDTLQIATADTILDTDFTNASSVEVLRLTGSSNVTIGEKADFTGITTVIGGTGSSTITHADKNYNALRLDGSNGSANLFVIQDEAALGLDTIIGGSGNDTLRLATGVRFEDTLLGNVSDVEVLQLSGLSDVELGAEAARSGISTITGGSGATSLDATAMTGSLVIDASAGSGTSFLLAGSGADTITGGSGADTLQGWATIGNGASDTLFGGTGADLFILGNATANAYGTSGSKALISDFTGGSDYLQLKDYGSGASSYRVDASAGAGYTHQLFDVSSGSDVLLANINYSGANDQEDLLGTKAIFA